MSVADKLTTIAENEQKVYEAGEKAVWSILQQNGNRTDYSYVFFEPSVSKCIWTDETFKPRYNIDCTNAQYMFRGTGITDLPLVFEKAGVSFTTKNCTGFGSMFAYSQFLKRTGVIDTTACDSFSDTFRADSLVTIDKLILRDDGSQTFVRTFATNPKELTNLTIEGVIGQNGFNVQWSPKLTHDSLMSIINALKDYSADTSGTTYTVTLGETNLKKLTNDELLQIDAKGWRYA